MRKPVRGTTEGTIMSLVLSPPAEAQKCIPPCITPSELSISLISLPFSLPSCLPVYLSVCLPAFPRRS